MKTKQLRAALNGVCAYQHMMDKPVMSALTGLLDGLCSGQGEQALGEYTRLFYALRSEAACDRPVCRRILR